MKNGQAKGVQPCCVHGGLHVRVQVQHNLRCCVPVAAHEAAGLPGQAHVDEAEAQVAPLPLAVQHQLHQLLVAGGLLEGAVSMQVLEGWEAHQVPWG